MPDDNSNDNDLLADLLDEEIAAGERDHTPAPNMDELNALKAKVEELELAKTGLLKAKQAQTAKRQSVEDKLAQIEGAVGALLSQRQQQGTESVSESQAAAARAQGLPVTYDDDGNGWIDTNSINQLISPYARKINELEQRLQQTDASTSAQANAQKVMSGIIGEDERFGPASGRYRAARKWVEDTVFDYARENGIKRVLSSGEALDNVFNDSYLRQEFAKNFDGIDIVDIVTAEDSQTNFRRTLDHIAGAMTPKDVDFPSPKDKMDSRFQKVLNKPSSLGNQANAKAGQLSVLERLNNVSTEDLMDFSDDQIDTLLKLAGRG